MSLFGNRNTTVHIGAFLDYASLTKLKSVNRAARDVSVSMIMRHMLAIGLKTEEQKLAYCCVMCERKTSNRPTICINKDKKYSVCDACRESCTAECDRCRATRLTYFMVIDKMGTTYCGNGKCYWRYEERVYQLVKGGFSDAGITDDIIDDSGNKWTDDIDITLVRQHTSASVIEGHYLIGCDIDPDTRRCDSCYVRRDIKDLVSYPITPLRDKFGVFCRDKSCMPEYSVPKSWQVSFVYDKSWR